MAGHKIEVGTIVHHPKRPAWGPGKALAVGSGGQVTVYFRDLEEGEVGDAVKTISTAVVGLDVADEQSDPMLDNLPPFTKGRFAGVRKPRLSLDLAVQAFLEAHPEAFDDSSSDRGDRSKVVEAHELWAETLGDGHGEALLDAGDLDEACRRVVEVGARFEHLSPAESASLEAALEENSSAEPFLRALIDVAGQETPEQASFQRLIDTIDELPAPESGPRLATWPVLTLFPFLARPDRYAPFQPSAVQRCAARLNFDLRYSNRLNWWTYDRLLEMAGILLERLRPLGARDFIDVRSVIRVLARA